MTALGYSLGFAIDTIHTLKTWEEPMSEATPESRWDLTTLYTAPDAPELTADLEETKLQAAAFRSDYSGNVAGLDAADLLTALVRYEALSELIAKPQLYAHLLFASDSGDDVAKCLSQQTAEFGNLMSRELLFFNLEIMALSDEAFAAVSADPALVPYGHHLGHLRRFTPHTLTEREEQLLTLKSLSGVDAFTRLYDELSASLLYRMELDGVEREFTGEELLSMLHHPDAIVRERAFTTFLKKHEEQEIVLGTVFNTALLDHSQEIELRGYDSPMAPTNLGNELSAKVVARLMEISEQNYGLAREYFELKARLLELPKLKNSDIYAPLPGADKKFNFTEAVELVKSAFRQFSPAWEEIITAFFTDRRVDIYPRSGKSGGAFCMGMTPSFLPYVLLNYTGNLRDVATVAHELGHGLHFVLAQKQRLVNYHPCLPLAETASVFGEMLLTRHLLDTESDPGVKIELLCAKIEDIIATTFRQTVLTRFELRLHLERKNGLLSNERIGDIWLEENSKLFGDAVEMIPAYRWGWSYISHFIHSRFYCYSYTFAELLVLALFQKYREEGESFKAGYRQLLESGGALSPADTAKLAGIDITEAGFWQKGYDFLGGLIEELRLVV